MSLITRRVAILFCVLLGIHQTTSSAADLEDKHVPGQWVERRLDFSYFGLTTFYSCSGNEAKLETILSLLGAQAKPTVNGFCDVGSGYPSRISGAFMRYRVWMPQEEASEPKASQPDASAALSSPPSFGGWQDVVIEANSRLNLGDGDCELIMEVRHQLIPTFAAQVVEDQFHCMPREVTPHSYRLRLKVFKPAS